MDKHKKKHASEREEATVMELTVLGSGTGLPSLQRNAPGYLLKVAGLRLLVDCGSGTLLQLLKVEEDCRAIDGVFFTHLHVDHIGDLMPLVHALRQPQSGRAKPLFFYGPPGFVDFYAHHVEPVAGRPDLFELFVKEVQPEQAWGELKIYTTEVTHVERLTSVAYRFECNDKAMVFTGDSDEDPRLIPLAREAEILIMDCSSLEVGKIKGHLCAAGCGRIATAAEAKRVLLSHLYPIGGPDSMRLSECRKHFTGTVRLAEDLMYMAI